MLDDDSNNYGSESGSSGTCTFPFRFVESAGCIDHSVGRVCAVGSGVIVLTGIESFGDVVPLVMFVQIGVESKGSRLIEIFWRPKS